MVLLAPGSRARKLGQRPQTVEEGAGDAVEGRGATVGFRRTMADAEVVVGNKDIWLGLLLSALRGRIELRGESLAPTSSGPTTAAPPGVISFLIASFVEFRVHPTGVVSTVPGESLSSVGAGGGDGRVTCFLKAPPWSC